MCKGSLIVDSLTTCQKFNQIQDQMIMTGHHHLMNLMCLIGNLDNGVRITEIITLLNRIEEAKAKEIIIETMNNNQDLGILNVKDLHREAEVPKLNEEQQEIKNLKQQVLGDKIHVLSVLKGE